MTYAQMMEQAVKEGRSKEISIEIHRWETEGEIVIGRVVAVEKKLSDTFDSEYNQYLLETDNGLIATIFGAGVDMLFKTQDPKGKVYAFTYKGKRKLESGKTMNVFTVTSITEHEGRTK